MYHPVFSKLVGRRRDPKKEMFANDITDPFYKVISVDLINAFIFLIKRFPVRVGSQS